MGGSPACPRARRNGESPVRGEGGDRAAPPRGCSAPDRGRRRARPLGPGLHGLSSPGERIPSAPARENGLCYLSPKRETHPSPTEQAGERRSMLGKPLSPTGMAGCARLQVTFTGKQALTYHPSAPVLFLANTGPQRLEVGTRNVSLLTRREEPKGRQLTTSSPAWGGHVTSPDSPRPHSATGWLCDLRRIAFLPTSPVSPVHHEQCAPCLPLSPRGPWERARDHFLSAQTGTPLMGGRGGDRSPPHTPWNSCTAGFLEAHRPPPRSPKLSLQRNQQDL